MATQVKVQQLEFDYTKFEEEEDQGINNFKSESEITEFSDNQQSAAFPSATDGTAPSPAYSEHEVKTSQLPDDDVFSTIASALHSFTYETASSSSYSENELTDPTTTSTTTAPVDEFTREVVDASHLLVETVHDAAEEELSTGWGWFGNSEPSVSTTTPKPQKKRRKKQRKRRGRRRKRVQNGKLVGGHDGMNPE